MVILALDGFSDQKVYLDFPLFLVEYLLELTHELSFSPLLKRKFDKVGTI